MSSNQTKTIQPNSVKDNFIPRLASDIKRVIATALLGDDTTVLNVELSKDAGTATVFVTHGADKLAKKAGFLRHEIAENIRMKRVPNIRFINDIGEANAKRVDDLLSVIAKQSGGAK